MDILPETPGPLILDVRQNGAGPRLFRLVWLCPELATAWTLERRRHAAAHRIFRDPRDLVIALPTSTGKTRIAELAILACLAKAAGRCPSSIACPVRTERARSDRTFAPPGHPGLVAVRQHGLQRRRRGRLRSGEIVFATPEELDFALRSDPSVLDDVGLIELDEGHLICASEREVRYEAQIQRLLRTRPGASSASRRSFPPATRSPSPRRRWPRR
ncbi:DEAD/DEAH box helicase [Micromonospora zamorensis]|uniref:DEAD/DEAH box helicase n=1 Tax=Micromonospora zamorensis TaxID=709883 RepID=UPI003D90AB91